MKKEPFETISTDDLAAATGGEAKAYTFGADFKADPQTCFRVANRVGRSYGLRLKGSGSDFSLVNRKGVHGGSAYTSEGGDSNCHIYVN